VVEERKEKLAAVVKYYRINELKSYLYDIIYMSSVFQKNIQEWVTVDNQIKTLNQEIKELRGNRNSLTNNIFTYAESNNLENAVIQISDGKLKFQNLKQTAPISFKLVKEVLNECIDNEEHVEAIITAIKNKRESKYTYDIKRTYA
jgi:hypothetical protein